MSSATTIVFDITNNTVKKGARRWEPDQDEFNSIFNILDMACASSSHLPEYVGVTKDGKVVAEENGHGDEYRTKKRSAFTKGVKAKKTKVKKVTTVKKAPVKKVAAKAAVVRKKATAKTVTKKVTKKAAESTKVVAKVTKRKR